jgi:uncharacterized protein (DUF58 family)
MKGGMVFDSTFLKKLEYLSLVSRRVFRGRLLAQRHTKQLGSGVEFAEHRNCYLGDDLRYLDWNVYARLGSELIKRFEEEEDLHVYFFLDCSGSMAFGEPQKFQYACQVTAALAYSALADLDRVSLVAIADGIVDTFPLTRGKQCILMLLRFLERQQPQASQTDLARAISDFLHRRHRRGLALVVSDFFDPRGFEKGIDRLRHHRFEPHLIQIHDPREARPELLGDLELIDMESRSQRNVTVTEGMLRRYREVFQAFLESIQRYCLNYGVGCTRTSTDIPFDQLILRMMRASGNVL